MDANTCVFLRLPVPYDPYICLPLLCFSLPAPLPVNGLATLTETLGDWFRSDLVIVPPEPEQALVQGGAFLFDNAGEMKYCHTSLLPQARILSPKPTLNHLKRRGKARRRQIY